MINNPHQHYLVCLTSVRAGSASEARRLYLCEAHKVDAPADSQVRQGFTRYQSITCDACAGRFVPDLYR